MARSATPNYDRRDANALFTPGIIPDLSPVLPTPHPLEQHPLYVTARQLGYTEMLLALSEKATEDQNLEHMRRELFSIVIGQMRKTIKSNSTTAHATI